MRTLVRRCFSFNWEDPLALTTLLSEEEKLVMLSARQYCQEKLKPRVIQATRKRYFDRQIMKEYGEMGFLGATQTEYGLPGISQVANGLIIREVERVDSSFKTALTVQSNLVMFPILSYGSKEQKDKYIPGLASGELIGCFGLTEPNAGSNPMEMETHAKLDGEDYVISGSKTWISNAPLADVFLIWAKDEAHEIRGFLLEKGMKGLSTSEIVGKMSLPASSTGMVMMDEVRVPKSAKFQSVKGLKGPLSCLNNARFGIAWGSLGAAEACYAAARNYTLDRQQFGKPLASFQLIQKKLADMATEISIGLQAVYQVSRLKEKGLANPEMISLIKRNSTTKALAIARDARDMLGGNGIVDEYEVMRHLVNLESVHTYEGTADIQALILGRAITGIQSFS
jgi:glutaryl-CoA dehydrogenase